MFEGIFQPMHLLILLGIVLLVFGPKKLPDLGKGMGEAIRGFKKAMYESHAEQRQTGDSHTPPGDSKDRLQ